MDIKQRLRICKDEFNKMRAMIDIGRELSLIEKYLPEHERKKITDRYNDEDVNYLRLYLRGKRNDTETS